MPDQPDFTVEAYGVVTPPPQPDEEPEPGDGDEE